MSRQRNARGRPAGSIHIGLMWHSPRSHNLGIGALTVAHLALLRATAAELGLTPTFTIFAGREDGHRYVDAPDVAEISVSNAALLPGAIVSRQARTLDVAFDIGGGDSFSSLYGAKRFARYSAAKLHCLRAGVPLILAPQTIGPFRNGVYARVAGELLARCDAIFTRDAPSLVETTRLAPLSRPMQVTDVAFALPWTTRPRGPRTKRRIGINASGLLFDDRNGLSFASAYRSLTMRLLDRLAADPSWQVELFTHVAGPPDVKDNDAPTADALAGRFPSAIRIPDFEAPSDAKTYIAQLDFAVSARMHACIAALSAGVPVIPLSYSRKFEGLFGALGYDWTIPLATTGEDAALSLILDAVAQAEEIGADAVKASTVALDRIALYRAHLRRILGKVGAAGAG